MDEGSGQILADSSGNGNNGYLGTTTGSEASDPTWNSTAGNGTPDGVVSTAYEVPRYIPKASALTFDGSATKVAITNPAADRVAMASGSYSVWFNRSAQDDTLRAIYDVAGTGNNGLIVMGDGGTTHGCTAGASYFQWGTGSGTWGKCGPVPTNGTWYQAAFTWTTAGIKVYINGSLYTSDTTHTPSITLGTNSYLGSNGGSVRFFNGTIGETRLYNRVLTATEISQQYANASTQTVVPGQNLLEAWRMDEGTGTTANDASGVGASGTITMGSGAWLLNQAITPSTQQAYFQTVAPIANSASSSDYFIYYGNPNEQNTALSSPQTSRTGLSFNSATSDKVTLPTVTLSGDFTWSTWVQATGTNYTTIAALTDGSGYGFQLQLANATNYAYVRFDNASASNQNAGGVSINIRDGAWHNVGMKYVSSTSTFTTFVDGTMGTPHVISGVAPTVYTASTFGYSPSGSTGYKGYLDDSRLFSRALSSTEIADLFNSGNTPPVSNNSLLAWWKFDEASGTSAADSSGNSNTGTLTNFNFNTTDGWTLNPNLWQASSITTNVTNLAAMQQAPCYFRYATKSAVDWSAPSWSAELPITTGPTALGATGVKVIWNPEGHYDHYDTFSVLSWVVEAASSTRGTRRSFPAQAQLIVDSTGAINSSLDIINAATNNLWMRIIGGNSSSNSLVWKTDTMSTVTALNGNLFAGLTWNTIGGVMDFSLASDTAYRWGATSNTHYLGTLAQRGNDSGFASGTGTGLNYTAQRWSSQHRSIAVQVINGQTFLAAASPLSSPKNLYVIRDISAISLPAISRTFTRVLYSRTSPTNDAYDSVALTSAGILYANNVTQGGVDRWDTAATDTSNVTGSVTRSYLAIGASTGANSIAVLPSSTVNAIAVNPGTSIAETGSNEISVGTSAGVVVIDEHSTIGSSQVYYLEQTGSTGTSGWNSKGFGNVMETNGSTYAKVAIDTALDPGMSDFTVEGWFKTSASCASSCQIIKNNSGAANTPGWQVYINNSNKLVGHFAYNTGVTVSSLSTVNDGVWHHFAVERTGTTTVKLFVDGVSQGTSTDASLNNTITSGAPTYIGAANGPASFFTGQIDEIRASNLARYSATFTPQKTEFITDANTVGLWHFDEPYGQYFADVSGNGYNATLGATSAVSTDDPLHVSPSIDGAASVAALGYKTTTDQGEGLTFSGSNYVSIPDNANLDILTGSKSWSFWFKSTSASSTFFRKSDANNANGVQFYFTSSQKMNMLFDGLTYSLASNTSGLNDGIWHNAVGVFDRSAQKISIYIDGVFNSSLSTPIGATNLDGTTQATIGTTTVGTMDDMRIYSSVLSPAYISALYNGGRGWSKGGAETNLVGAWALNEGSGTTTADYSGNGYTGTLTSSPTWTSGTPVRDQPMLWIGTNDAVSVGAVTAVSLITGRQIKSYTTSNSVLPGYAVSALSVGSGGLALVGTGGYGAWSPGSAGTVVEDPLTLAALPVADVRIKGGARLKGGVTVK